MGLALLIIAKALEQQLKLLLSGRQKQMLIAATPSSFLHNRVVCVCVLHNIHGDITQTTVSSAMTQEPGKHLYCKVNSIFGSFRTF